MSAPVRYIDRTRDYYLGQGYDKPYEWAHHTDVPFTPLTKPLSESQGRDRVDVGHRDEEARWKP